MAKIGLIGIAAVFLSMLFKKEKPEFAVLTGIAASVIIFSIFRMCLSAFYKKGAL